MTNAGVSSEKITFCFASYKEEDEACHVLSYTWTWLLRMHASNWKMKNLAIPRFLSRCTHSFFFSTDRSFDYTTSCEFSIVETKLLPFCQNKINHMEFLFLSLQFSNMPNGNAASFVIFFRARTHRENKSDWHVFQHCSICVQKNHLSTERETIYQEKIWPFFRRWF